MANRFNTVRNTNFTTSHGGTISANDSVFTNEGNDAYTAGKDLSAVDLARFSIGPNRRGAVGTADYPMILVVDQTGTGVYENLGGGSGAREYVRSGSGAGVINKIVNNPAGNGSLNVATCTCPTIVQQRGSIVVQDSVTPTNIYQTGGTALYDESSNAATLVDVAGGAATLKRDTATLKVRQNANTVLDHTGVSPATLTEVAGTLTVQKCGTHAAMTLLPGAVLDLSRLEQPFTITALTSYAGSIIRKKAGHPVDVTISGHTPIGEGYRIEYV